MNGQVFNSQQNPLYTNCCCNTVSPFLAAGLAGNAYVVSADVGGTAQAGYYAI